MKQNSEYKIISEGKAALEGKCPRCRTGNMFRGPMYGFKSQKMEINCPHCNLRFEREPGYFYVSMFVSYALNVAQLIAVCLATYVITQNGSNPWLYITVALVTAFVASPFNFRYSRIILMYWLTPGLKFNPDFYGENSPALAPKNAD